MRVSSDPETRDDGRPFDGTSLRESVYAPLLHRDYLAHSFRWGWATRFVKEGMTVLDVGCGVDLPLAKIFRYSNSLPSRYVGVDWNRVEKKLGNHWCQVLDSFDFTTRWAELGAFDVVACFEVIEHMRVDDGRRLLAGLRGCLGAGGTVLLSTPVFNGRAAANHLHEYDVDELQREVEAVGFTVEARYGTFASYPDLKRVLTPAHREVYEGVRCFYGDEVAACFLAPLYPDASRNNAWVLR